MNEFSCVGLDISNSDEMYDFVSENGYNAVFLQKNNKNYLRLDLNKLGEMWFYQYDEEGLINTSSPCIYHKSRFMTPVEIMDNLTEDAYGPVLLNVTCEGGEIDFPMNVCIADGGLVEDLDEMEHVGAGISLIPRELFFFQSEKEFAEKIQIPGYGVECFVPTGMIPEDPGDMDNFQPSATAMICGSVLDARYEVNEISKKRYVVIGLSCLGYMFDCVACEEMLKSASLPEKDSILAGRFWITGRIFK